MTLDELNATIGTDREGNCTPKATCKMTVEEDEDDDDSADDFGDLDADLLDSLILLDDVQTVLDKIDGPELRAICTAGMYRRFQKVQSQVQTFLLRFDEELAAEKDSKR